MGICYCRYYDSMFFDNYFFLFARTGFRSCKRYVGIGTCVIAIGQHLIWFNTYVLQMSNRIKDYSKVVVFDKFIFVFGIILSVFCIDYNYKTLIMALVITRYISALYSIFLCKEIFFQLPNHCFLGQAIFDYKNNLECGFKLLISSFRTFNIRDNKMGDICILVYRVLPSFLFHWVWLCFS